MVWLIQNFRSFTFYVYVLIVSYTEIDFAVRLLCEQHPTITVSRSLVTHAQTASTVLLGNSVRRAIVIICHIATLLAASDCVRLVLSIYMRWLSIMMRMMSVPTISTCTLRTLKPNHLSRSAASRSASFIFLLSFFLPSATFYFAHAYFRLDAAAMKVYTFRCNFPFINGRTMIRWSS